MRTNIIKVMLMAIAICTVVTNTTFAQGHHHNGRGGNHQSARVESPHGRHGGHIAAPHAGNHSSHHAPNMHHSARPIGSHHVGMVPRAHRHVLPIHHHYTVVRYPHALPAYVHYRHYDVLPVIGSILTDLPLNAIEVLIGGHSYYSALGLLFRPFYIDGIMHFEVVQPI